MTARRYAWGAEPVGDGMWSFRLWAPTVAQLSLRLDGNDLEMTSVADGWFDLTAPAREGMPYEFVLPGGQAVPDPAARRQSGDVHAPSLLTAPRRARGWCARPWRDAVIYELHVGTFTRDGTFRAAADDLARLADLGVTAIEIMPVAQFGGDRGWGYDGVLPYAPHPAYGTPDDLAALVDAAHDSGLMVLLDVVYNHFGPDGNYLGAYAAEFFDEGRQTPWGAGIDYTRAPVRRLFIDNALYWLGEFGFDGLRLDAIDQIVDPSRPELLIEMAHELRGALPDCPVHLTTEDNRNVTHLHERDGGQVRRHTAEWNDDMHNAAHVLATGEEEGYYAPFADDPLRYLARSLAEGFAFQGEGGRGQPSAHLPPVAFVDFLQNHDQTGNRARGERLISLTDTQTLHALVAVHLLSPHIPLMFMGEEYDETRPFLFFAGFGGELGDAVRDGRRREFAEFAGFEGGAAEVPDPIAPETFQASKLDPDRRRSEGGQAALERTRHLLDLRHRRIVPLLGAVGGQCGRIVAADDGVLAVDWQLDGGLLQMRANFSSRRRDLPPARGDLLHAVGTPGDPRSAAHWLDQTR
ncbi:malto-oligosyltrehalose trehalohydrolase [Palleronia rufa]|uniref:malto-oligosyltrehalose trehalohydrolase n=1 Tax=Palleronia rufa TaxID=1530186 RepID=UPI00056B0D8B|nr:malto-oligosyltrehalose trehalohydrolase [Palleronia rufa]